MSDRPKLTVYQRIVRAARLGRGLRLTAQDCHDLCRDDAITTRANLDDWNSRGVKDRDLIR